MKRFWSYVHVKGAIEVWNIINISINNIIEKKPVPPAPSAGKCVWASYSILSKLLGYQMV